MRLKLLIDTSARRVIVAEVGKDFVDFLLYLFSLPIGSVVKLLAQKNMTGCIDDLHKSLETFSMNHMQPNQSKTSLLNPKSPISATGLPLLLSNHEPETWTFYSCSNNANHSYVAEVPNLICPTCKAEMTFELSYVSPTTANTVPIFGEGGFVKGLVNYMVTDNLEVMPMSTISAITLLLKKCSVNDFSSLEERIVYVGMEEVRWPSVSLNYYMYTYIKIVHMIDLYIC